MSETKYISFHKEYKFFMEASFYTQFREIKLHQQKLQSTLIELPGTRINHTNRTITLSEESFFDQNEHESVLGCIRNFNTIEEFKQIDKLAYLKDIAVNKEYDKFFYHIISYADLKKFTLVYWICIPSLNASGLKFSFEQADFDGKVCNEKEQLFSMLSNHTILCKPTVCKLNINKDELEASFFLRNIMIKEMLRSGTEQFELLIEGDENTGEQSFTVKPNKSITLETTRIKGWEKNMEGKLMPKFINFSSLLDPIQLNEQNVSLNLELMKWRINPDLDLELLKRQRVLLLGAGTLGCYISRCLLAWGIYDITFVDNGEVSHSNPVRQPLFNFEDVGKPKAETASMNLKKIYPLCNSSFSNMKIPMIGHVDTIDKETFLKLETLIIESDVVFLLTDSRESRWLPTLIGKSENKTVINAAIGYDSYLVMRQGIYDGANEDLGCYFCSDVLAPVDSLKNRTLDQMCTVTRPGCALMASSMAVELLVDYLLAKKDTNFSYQELPNQIRGFLTDFSIRKNNIQSYKHCSACSDNLIREYRENKWDFVKKALADSNYVENVSGLAKVHLETEQLLLDMEELGF